MFKFRVFVFLSRFLFAFNVGSSQPTISEDCQCVKLNGDGSEWLDRMNELQMENAHLKRSLQAERHRGAYPIRLVNPKGRSSNPMSGRLEIQYDGTWGTVCNDGFATPSARVACAALGFGYIGKVVANTFGIGAGPIWLNGVDCTGNELSIGHCQHRPWGCDDCNHTKDVAISCDYLVRLANPKSRHSNGAVGLLEIYYSGTWGSVCNDFFGDREARVACASLGFMFVGKVISNVIGIGSGPIWLDDVNCTNNDGTHLGSCDHRPWGKHNCDKSESVAISCEYPVRLVDPNCTSSNPTIGRLEINYNGTWGTVCNNSFTTSDAIVACAALGFGHVGKVVDNTFGIGAGPIWLDDTNCKGNEPNLASCKNRPWGVNDCQHSNDVAINCEVRLRIVKTLEDVQHMRVTSVTASPEVTN